MSDDDLNLIFEELEGEQIDEEIWEIVDEKEQGEVTDYEEWAKSLIKEYKKKN